MLGPIIAFTVGAPLIRHIVRLAKAQNFTSIADFMSARFGKSQPLSVLISVGLIVAVLPYIALQLEAIATSVDAPAHRRRHACRRRDRSSRSGSR